MTERDSDIPETAAARPAQTAPVVAVVLAAGFGTRFDPDNPKQLVLSLIHISEPTRRS